VSFPEKISFKSQSFSLIEVKTAVDVHFRVQTLQRLPTSTAGTWAKGKDSILGEYRGVTSLKRVIENRQFAP
jgi:hypothetical protein